MLCSMRGLHAWQAVNFESSHHVHSNLPASITIVTKSMMEEEEEVRTEQRSCQVSFQGQSELSRPTADELQNTNTHDKNIPACMAP